MSGEKGQGPFPGKRLTCSGTWTSGWLVLSETVTRRHLHVSGRKAAWKTNQKPLEVHLEHTGGHPQHHGLLVGTPAAVLGASVQSLALSCRTESLRKQRLRGWWQAAPSHRMGVRRARRAPHPPEAVAESRDCNHGSSSSCIATWLGDTRNRKRTKKNKIKN